MLVSMTDNQAFEIGEYPKDGRLAKYERELLILLKTQDKEGIIAFSQKIFSDCMEYLKTTLNVSFPNLVLNIINHKEYTELCNRLDMLLGVRPRTKAIIVGSGHSIANVYIDFERHFKGKPSEFIVNLCTSYIEELIHSASPLKSETQIHEVVCSAIEGFIEIKLPDFVKEERLKYAKTCDKIKQKSNSSPPL